jgi:hypothetical protein
LFTWLLVGLLLITAGCSNEPKPSVQKQPPSVQKQKLAEMYPGDITKVDQIQILNGMNGMRAVFTDTELIRQWIDKIKEIDIVADPNQEGRAGFMYAVNLLEGKEYKLSFNSSSVGKQYNLSNEKLNSLMEELWSQRAASGGQ